jgi:hypothetical protein
LLALLSVLIQPPLHASVPEGHAAAHLPAAHTFPALHRVPQAPQSSTLLAVSTHTPLQRVCPPGQTQRLALQVVPPVHTTPHAPQFSESLDVVTQLRAQLVWPVAQLARHRLSPHTWVVVHAVPQPPQLFGSLRSIAQPLAHRVSLAGHTQAPDEQLALSAQVVAQLPQWLSEVARFTHARLHEVSCGAQVSAHAPRLHTWLAGQAFPQAPQLLGSLAPSEHPLAQAVSPSPHAQAPDTQDVPVGHAAPQVPQFFALLSRSTHERRHGVSP